MHLAIGEWIVRNRAVPFLEPFAWTRAGDPFYAYSWLVEVVFFLVAEAGGNLGLRLLQGAVVSSSFGAMIVAGNAAKWPPHTSAFMGILNVIALGVSGLAIRPQAFLFVLIPLAFAFTVGALDGRRPARSLIGLFIVSVLAANTHTFFPLTGLPIIFAIAQGGAKKQKLVSVALIMVGGWCVSPYASEWPAIFALNLAPNALLSRPSPINELEPGFIAMWNRWPLIPFALFLSLLPWNVLDIQYRRATRILLVGTWLIGLVLFASAVRFILVWWLLALPLAAIGVHETSRRLLADENQGTRLLRITAVWLVCATLILATDRFDRDDWTLEDLGRSRTSAWISKNGIDRLATWLECNTHAEAKGRVFTAFDYGSALTWRLPQYSMSIDGRTIFPDSVAKPEALYEPFNEPLREGPWRSADLAILRVPSAISEVLEKAGGWKKVAVAHWADGSMGLWARQDWWDRWSKVGATARPVSLMPTVASVLSDSCSRTRRTSRRSAMR